MLVNDIWGGEKLFKFDTPVWEHDLDDGLRLLRLALDTHLITLHHALPLLIREPGGLLVEMTDGTAEYNAANYRVNAFYDLAKTSVIRLAFGQAKELEPHGATAVALTPGWLRSEMMLDTFKRHRGELARGDARSRSTSSSRSHRGSSAARSPRSPPTRTATATTAPRCRAAGWRRSTASTTSTARGRTAGATWPRWSTRAASPTPPATASPRGGRRCRSRAARWSRPPRCATRRRSASRPR